MCETNSEVYNASIKRGTILYILEKNQGFSVFIYFIVLNLACTYISNSLVLFKDYKTLGLPNFTIKRLLFFIIYSFILFWEIIKANFDVAYRIIHPKMPIKPGIVIIKTRLKSNIGKLALANSITLTPGTFTLDIVNDRLLIHWINVKFTDIEKDTKIIGEKFEKYLRIIFE